MENLMLLIFIHESKCFVVFGLSNTRLFVVVRLVILHPVCAVCLGIEGERNSP